MGKQVKINDCKKIVPIPSTKTKGDIEPNWKVAVSGLQKGQEELKNELKTLKNSFEELKHFIMTQLQNKTQTNFEAESNKENFENPYIFEHKSKKIKLEKVENQIEVKQESDNSNLFEQPLKKESE